MNKPLIKKSKFKLIISLFWLVLTFSMVSWWFLVALKIDHKITLEDSARHERMIFWEGSFLLTAILVGGIFLVIYVYRDLDRHEKLKFFFSNFSHDIKTSISRLRLQAEILSEDTQNIDLKILSGLKNDLAHLDLQLENSLLLTHLDGAIILTETISLGEFIQGLRLEFDQIEIKSQDTVGRIFIQGDSRALKSIFKNIIENSIRHGKSNIIAINAELILKNKIQIQLQDNGLGTDIDHEKIGKAFLSTTKHSSNGIGLYLAKKLIEKMHGEIKFSSLKSAGFLTEIILPGLQK